MSINIQAALQGRIVGSYRRVGLCRRVILTMTERQESVKAGDTVG
ncbi:MAG: hypothetical protein ORN57_03250 [Alphaproteobacteria bacterium]|nr:hypothetical protein [Alphaproteobacteria bacterium]